jgi:hypothetical protein
MLILLYVCVYIYNTLVVGAAGYASAYLAYPVATPLLTNGLIVFDIQKEKNTCKHD